MIYESTTIKIKNIVMEDGSCMVTRTKTSLKVDGLRVYVSRTKRVAAEVSELDDDVDYASDYNDFTQYRRDHHKEEAYR